jgi:pimeloyl-ACP methyl ester carboxylesterase
VAVDQRGTGGSNPLRSAAKNLDSPGAVVGGLFDLYRIRACRVELEKRANLTRYTTSNLADDVDDVRAALATYLDCVGRSILAASRLSAGFPPRAVSHDRRSRLDGRLRAGLPHKRINTHGATCMMASIVF